MKKALPYLIVLLLTFSLAGCVKKSSSLPFPFPSSVSNMIEKDGSANFKTSMEIEDTLSFYKTELSAMGLTERELNTAVTDTTFSIVYDGYENGKAIVVQGVTLDVGSTNVNIRFEEI